MKILTGLAALLLSGALACTDEMLPAPSAEAPSCKEGRIWYESTCIDPSAQEERENPVPEQGPALAVFLMLWTAAASWIRRRQPPVAYTTVAVTVIVWKASCFSLTISIP